ncbi:MAG: type I methionyl aminopeptidase [Phycisphaerales bacterium]|nr:type I methionyl aminopeptidase [Phycisphaerales bacterium]
MSARGTTISKLSPADAELAYAAAQKVVETHRRIVGFVKPGRTLAEIDHEIGKILASIDCRSCFLGYRIPKLPAFQSHACLSVNDCVVHGWHGYLRRPLERGDLLKIDVGVWHQGWVGDAAWTYAVGEADERQRRLMECGKESLRRGVEQLKPGSPLMNWAKTVQETVELKYGFRCVRGLGGHGYGRSLHGPPFVSNVLPAYAGEWPDAFLRCQPGMLLAVEPMIAVGTGATHQGRGEWPIFSADRSMSVHYEADVLITEDGPRDLTEGLSSQPDVVG